MKSKGPKFLILILLLTIVYGSYLNFRSSILQAVLILDYNNRTYTLNVDDFNKFNLTFPNITRTTIPIELLKGRYYNKIDSTKQAIKLFKKSISTNPYLKMAEGELSQAYYKLEDYDSAYFFGKNAFTFIPKNNTHRYGYFNSLVKRNDSIELEAAFNIIKQDYNKGHWVHYLLSRKNISKKYTPHIDSILNLYIEKFDTESTVSNNMLRSRLERGGQAVYSAVEISFEGERLFNQKKYLESAQTYELAILVNPYDYTFFQNAAIAYANTDKYEKALNYFDKVIYEFKIADGKSHFYKGVLLLKLQEQKEACKYLQQASVYNFSGESSSFIYSRYCN
tara:strand:+ start:2947 stop:3957 length:1011 start_codon:yes stop_codon:yes gene_type:complete